MESTTPRKSRVPSPAWPWLLIAAVALLACLPMIGLGASNGHSLPLNLMWLREFSAQLLAGEAYPRWLAGMNEGAGSPTFFFYPPLAFYLASLAPVACSSCDPSVQLALGECLLLALSGLAFYAFARRIGGALAAALGAIAYMLLPYHYEIDLWHRQALAEFAAYIWIPLVFLFIDRIASGRGGVRGLAIGYALLVFAHLPAALLMSPFFAIYALLLAQRERSPMLAARFAAGISIGLLLASIYLAPALLTQEYISPRFWWRPYFAYHRWFFLDGAAEPNASFGERLFFVLALSSAMFALLLAAAAPCLSRNRTARLYLPCALVGLAWLLMSPLSRPVWEWLPALQKVQFPWRVAIAIDFAVALAAVYAIDCALEHRKRVSLSLLGIALALFGYAFASGLRANYRSLDVYQSPKSIEVRDRRIEAGRDAPEYFPTWIERAPRLSVGEISMLDEVAFDRANGEVEWVRIAPRRFELNADLSAPTALVVRHYFYPGWRAELEDGTELEIRAAAETGLIEVMAPAGRHRISFELAALREERIGAALSALGLALVVAPSIARRLRSSARDAQNRARAS